MLQVIVDALTGAVKLVTVEICSDIGRYKALLPTRLPRRNCFHESQPPANDRFFAMRSKYVLRDATEAGS